MLRGVPANEREHLTLAMRECLKRLQTKRTKQR
jgi:hypothetical protein